MLTINIKVVTVLATICCFTPSAVHAGGTQMLSLSPQQKVVVQKHERQFARLWLSRRQKRVTPQLLQILRDDPSPYLREHIVMALGRIEDPTALPALQALLVKVKALGPPQAYGCDVIRFKDVPPYRVQLAIGRIKARNLKGTPKLNTIARELGKTWPSLQQDARKLRLKLQERMGVYEVQESDERFILEEFYDVLYRMGKRGENIRALGAYTLLIWPQQGAWIKAAALPNAAEVKYWLKRAVPPSRTGFDPAYLLDLGATVEGELMNYLKIVLTKAQTNPKLFAQTRVYTSAFDAAAQTGSRNFLPVLRGFQKVNDHWTRTYAGRAIGQLESGRNVVRFPSS